ncbi:MAG: SpoIIE family protein phosphatase [Bacteroidetes bacterium]|nr:SpoIIE family protein phosphatase [Bacteroidota bacterium]
MNYFVRILILLSISLTLINAQQNYQFKNFSEAEKLSNTTITDFFQDSYGFMWIATEDGLNRYDGKSVKIYKNRQGDETSLPDNAVMQIVEDKDKNLWAACYNAVGKLDRKTDKFKRYGLDNLPLKAAPNFFNSMLDSDGNVWFSLSEGGVIKYDKEKDTFVNFELSKLNETTVWGQVTNIIQLRNGVILAADAGSGIKSFNSSTNKFDPYYLKPGYSPKNVQSLNESSSGDIWFSGQNLLLKYSPIQYSIKQYDLVEKSKTKGLFKFYNDIVEDNKGDFWITIYSHGIFHVDKQFENIEQYFHDPSDLHTIQDNRLSNFYMDKFGILWISYLGGGLAQMDPNANPFDYSSINLSGRNGNQTIIKEIAPLSGSNSEVFLATNTDGILKYNTVTKETSKLNLIDPSVKIDSSNFINDLAVDFSGNIWFAINNSSLKRYDNKSKKIETIKSPYNRMTAAPFAIQSIDISPDNKIWISSNCGVDKYDPVTGKFISIPRIMNKKMDAQLKESLSQIKKSRKPISSILEVGESKNLKEPFTVNKKTNLLLMCIGEGRAVSGTFDRGGISVNEGNKLWEMTDIYETFHEGGGFKNRIGLKVLSIDKGDYNLYYSSDVGHSYGGFNVLAPDDSTSWGIQAFELSDDEYSNLKNLLEINLDNSKYLPFEFGRTIKFSKVNSNKIWIGTNTNSFFQYDLGTGDYIQHNFDKNNISDASHYIYNFYEDLDGILWVGTYASFLRLDPKTNELKSFTTLDGLPGGNIYSITEDNFGALWIYSSGGLSKLNKNAPIEKYSFINYDSKDGLDGLTSTTAVWKNEYGKLFFGGKGGIISFTPGNINTIEPDVVIHNFRIDDVSVFDDSSTYSIPNGIYDTKEIELSYNQNNIAFEFSSIHFSRPGKNKTTYQLEGFSSKWYESDKNFASFTNLDPGSYTFRVKGSNGDDIWNEKGRSISIVIHPPWWKTTFAYIGYAVILMVSIFGFDRYQRKKLLGKAREKMKMQEAIHRAEAAELQARAVQAENERKTKELEEARALQLSMLPKNLPALPHLDIAVYMKTATEVGGDYYDFNVGLDGTLTVVIGDATGHGMKAGTMVTAAKTLFNSYSANPDIIFTFHEMTRCIKQLQMQSVSMCLTMLKIKNNNLILSSAGMPPMFLFKRENRIVEEHLLKGMPLGSMNNFPYEIREMELTKGDTILLMSDGFPELSNDNNELYGYKRVRNKFEEVAEQEPEDIITYLKEEGSNWVNDNDPDDDVTFVVLKVK